MIEKTNYVEAAKELGKIVWEIISSGIGLLAIPALVIGIPLASNYVWSTQNLNLNNKPAGIERKCEDVVPNIETDNGEYCTQNRREYFVTRNDKGVIVYNPFIQGGTD